MNKVTNLRKSQEKPTELKKIITEIKNTVEGISSVLEDTAELKGELENRVMEIIGADEKKKGNEDSLRDLCDNIKHTNICIIGIPKGEKRKGQRTYLKI